MQARINSVKPTLTTVYLPGPTIVGRDWVDIPKEAEASAQENPYLETRKVTVLQKQDKPEPQPAKTAARPKPAKKGK